MTAASGPLAGLRVVEVAGIGPGPFCAMLLADLGAEVVRVRRPNGVSDGLQVADRFDLVSRNRLTVPIDLKQPSGRVELLQLVERADALIEGFRPGTMERLGLGPEECLARNAGLVYGRMTGWGQAGPLAHAAGHDVNYVALSGALHALGRRGSPPAPPLNLVGDLGGGAVLLAFGILAALYERRSSGRGQVVDAAMVDGAALLMTPFFGLLAGGAWQDRHGENVLDSAAHFYDVYETRDGRYLAIGAVEERFYRELMGHLGLSAADAERRFESTTWSERKSEVAEAIRTRTRDEWCALMEGTDACVAPVLSMREAPAHPHNVARGTFVAVDGVTQPGPAPRFSRTPPSLPRAPGACELTVAECLLRWTPR